MSGDCPLKTHKGKKTAERAEMRFELVKAMVVGAAGSAERGLIAAKDVEPLIAAADLIIDALEARHAAERRDE